VQYVFDELQAKIGLIEDKGSMSDEESHKMS
jgi:hypothetical protein